VLIGPIIAAQLLTVYEVENLFLFCLIFYFIAAFITSLAPKDEVKKKKSTLKKFLKN
jgi:hypothetical protein